MFQFGTMGPNYYNNPVFHCYFFVEGGAKLYSQTQWGPWPDELPWIHHTLEKRLVNYGHALFGRHAFNNASKRLM